MPCNAAHYTVYLQELVHMARFLPPLSSNKSCRGWEDVRLACAYRAISTSTSLLNRNRLITSFALPARQVMFGRSMHMPPQQQQYQHSQSQPYAQQQPQSQSNDLALPYAASYLPGPSGLILPGPVPTSSYPQQPVGLSQP